MTPTWPGVHSSYIIVLRTCTKSSWLFYLKKNSSQLRCAFAPPTLPGTSNLLASLKIEPCRCCALASSDTSPADSLSKFISSAVTGERANTTRESIFRSLHFSSSHLVLLPHCQRYALTTYPALLSFAWLHFNPLTHCNGPLWMRSTRRNPDVKAVCLLRNWKSSLHTTVYQPTSLPVWFTRCAWGSYVAPVFIASVFISSLETEKRHTQTCCPGIFISRQISKRKRWHEHTYILLLIGGALTFWEIEWGVVHFYFLPSKCQPKW